MLFRWTLTILVTLILAGAVVAMAASISISGTDKLGQGEAAVVAPAGITVDDVKWTLSGSNVTQVDIHFAHSPSTNPLTQDCASSTDGCSLLLVLKNGTVLASLGPLTPFYQGILGAGADGDGVNDTFVWDGGLSVNAEQIASFNIVIVDPDP